MILLVRRQAINDRWQLGTRDGQTFPNGRRVTELFGVCVLYDVFWFENIYKHKIRVSLSPLYTTGNLNKHKWPLFYKKSKVDDGVKHPLKYFCLKRCYRLHEDRNSTCIYRDFTIRVYWLQVCQAYIFTFAEYWSVILDKIYKNHEKTNDMVRM